MRLGMRVLLGLLLAGLQTSSCWAAINLDTMQPLEIKSLQRRLTEAGCYRGAVDGKENAATIVALQACPDQTPMLRIETGMHVAGIYQVQSDSNCSTIATISNDLTIRIWSKKLNLMGNYNRSSVLNLVRTIRVPTASGDENSTPIVALSPDAKWLAIVGVSKSKGDRRALHILDLVTGAMNEIGEIDKGVKQIKFSKDGTQIGISFEFYGLKIVSRENGREIFTNADYIVATDGLLFGTSEDHNFLITTSYDGFIRYYDSSYKINYKSKAKDGNSPSRLSSDRADNLVAVSYDDNNSVSIYYSNGLIYRSRVEVDGLSIEHNAISSWLSGKTSKLVLVGGIEKNEVFRFNDDFRFYDDGMLVSNNYISDMNACESEIIFAASDPRFGDISIDGHVFTYGESVAPDMRGKIGSALTLTADAKSVRFGLEHGEIDPVIFDLQNEMLFDSPINPSNFYLPDTNGLPVQKWQDNKDPSIKGITLSLAGKSVSHALAVRSDKSGFVIGGDRLLRAFDAEGNQIWQMRGRNDVTGVNLSKDGKIVIATYSDGTIRWNRWSDGKEILTLFIHVPTRRWVAWTPTGYYMASSGGEDLIGWQMNRGWDQEPDFFSASRFREKFNRPDVIQNILITLDEGEAVARADEAAHRSSNGPGPLINHLPPIINILSPIKGTRIPQGMVDINYRIRLPSGGKLDRVEAFVDGAKIEARGLAPIALHDDPDGSGHVTLPMPAHDTVVSLVAYAGGLASEATQVELRGVDPIARSDIKSIVPDTMKPSLYALLVGVSHYKNHNFDLEFAANDAIELAKTLKSQEGKLYNRVEVRVITDKDATAIGFKRGLNWLSKQTTARDLALVFASGHGLTDAKGKFWFLTEDGEPDDLIATAVSQDDLSNVLFDLPGKKMMMLDACHSGAALESGVKGLQPIDTSSAVNDFAQAEGGMVTYAASTGREFSLERPEWGHGAFTKALIEGFGGKADLLHNGTVTTATLDAYLEDRVKELTGGLQHPVMTRPKTVPDFPIASVQ